MPSDKPRVALTVPEDLKAVLDFTAEQSGVKVSQLIVEILQESKEQILAVGKAIEAAKKDPVKGGQLLNMMIENASRELGDVQLDIEDAIEIEKIKKKSKARKKAKA